MERFSSRRTLNLSQCDDNTRNDDGPGYSRGNSSLDSRTEEALSFGETGRRQGARAGNYNIKSSITVLTGLFSCSSNGPCKKRKTVGRSCPTRVRTGENPVRMMRAQDVDSVVKEDVAAGGVALTVVEADTMHDMTGIRI